MKGEEEWDKRRACSSESRTERDVTVLMCPSSLKMIAWIFSVYCSSKLRKGSTSTMIFINLFIFYRLIIMNSNK